MKNEIRTEGKALVVNGCVPVVFEEEIERTLDMSDYVIVLTIPERGYGTTPEERSLLGSGEADVAIVNTGVAIAVKTTEDPVNTKTTVSEIVLPSYERMDDTYALCVASDYARTFTGVLAAGSASGTAKVTLDPSTAAGTGTAYYYKKNVSAPLFGAVIDTSWTAYTSAANISASVGDTIAIVEANTTTKSVEAGANFYVNVVGA